MSEHTESLKVWLCLECGETERDSVRWMRSPYFVGDEPTPSHWHWEPEGPREYVSAEEVEVIPAEQLAKVEAERDKWSEDFVRTETLRTIDRSRCERFKERLTQIARDVEQQGHEAPNRDAARPLYAEAAAIREAISAAEQEPSDV